MKIMTVFGTRPEIIRLSAVIRRLDNLCDHMLVHTGQNYDSNLSDIFFQELNVRHPDIHLGVKAAHFADQVGQILTQLGDMLIRNRPDRLLILGDTNSGLSAIVAARMGIPVYHMEAGNRCYDDRVPEEINRRIIDHCSNILLPYTFRSKENLVREGIERQRIFVTGNPIFEVLQNFEGQINGSDVLTRLDLVTRQFFLVTLHRAENVDDPDRLGGLLRGLALVADTYQLPLVVSLHPRTADKLSTFGIAPTSERIRLLEPMGFCDFVKLEQNAYCVLTDSGTVQEECAILQTPNVTLRDVTERPETLEAGSNILSGAAPEAILQAVDVAVASKPAWTPPSEYLQPNVSVTVSNIVLGYQYNPHLS